MEDWDLELDAYNEQDRQWKELEFIQQTEKWMDTRWIDSNDYFTGQ